MAQTKRGQKYNDIPEHTRVVNGREVTVKAHRRSNPRTSTGASPAPTRAKPKAPRR